MGDSLLSVFLIALSLALDAFAVAVSSGVSVRGFSWRHAVKLGCWFGAFQYAMPLVGWFLGCSVSAYLKSFGHLLSFALLTLVGGRMILEALRGGQGAQAVTELNAGRLTALAVATSLDAFAVGVPLAFMEVNILLSAAVIGAVAFILSVAGGLLGRRLGVLFRRRAVLAGGLVLVGIGVKLLGEHLI